jgi:hypothetical protein
MTSIKYKDDQSRSTYLYNMCSDFFCNLIIDILNRKFPLLLVGTGQVNSVSGMTTKALKALWRAENEGRMFTC